MVGDADFGPSASGNLESRHAQRVFHVKRQPISICTDSTYCEEVVRLSQSARKRNKRWLKRPGLGSERICYKKAISNEIGGGLLIFSHHPTPTRLPQSDAKSPSSHDSLSSHTSSPLFFFHFPPGLSPIFNHRLSTNTARQFIQATDVEPPGSTHHRRHSIRRAPPLVLPRRLWRTQLPEYTGPEKAD
ncbi:hypothetical protein BJX76DRAFT_291959 [Aspergillus varians]